MRFSLLILVLCLTAMGCNSDPRCRRETALLRAEILDLEDKYYLMKSQRDDALATSPSRSLASDVASELSIDDGNIVYDADFGSQTHVGQGSSYYLDDGTPYLPNAQPIRAGGESYANPREVSPPGTAPMETPGGSLIREPDSFDLDNDRPELIEPLEDREDRLNDSLLEISDQHPKSILSGTANIAQRSSQTDLRLNGPHSNSELSTSAVTEILIDRQASRGEDVDGNEGDEGLNLLVQPKSVAGDTVLESGRLTVSLIDPQQSPARQRIGLWKFLPHETELFFADGQTDSSRGILLHLPWDQATPNNRNVVVYVRFETSDGRRLETSSPIRISPPAANYSPADPLVAGWTQRDARWSMPNEDSATSKNIATTEDFATTVADERYQRQSIPAVQASTGASQTQKPTWRPVR